MKINSINNLSFQKHLSANCSVIQNNEPKHANIYVLEQGTDDFYFYRHKWTDSWQEADYLDQINEDIVFNRNPNDIFIVMEDEDENLLGYSEISEYQDEVVLDFIETVPDCSLESVGRKIKYIGETMLAYIVSLCKLIGKDLEIHSVADSYTTRNFYYKNCGFEELSRTNAIMRKENFDKFLKHNKNHTGSDVEILV